MNMRTIIIPSLAVSVLALAACAPASDPVTSPTPSASDAAVERPSTERPEAQPRLVVTTDTDARVISVIDNTLAEITAIPTSAATRAAVGPDGRHVYLVDGEGGQTSVLDAGSYAQGHGDHFHFFTREPALRPDVITGSNPVHVVGHDGRVAIFNDGDGTVSVFDEIGLVSGGLQISTLTANAPHHGVAVPVEGGYLISSSAEGGLPESLIQVDAEGTEITSYLNVCPGLHGEASVDHLVLFGCTNGIAVIDPEAQTATTLPYPTGFGEARVGTIYATGDLAVGNFGPDAFLLIDAEAGTTTPVTTVAPLAAAAVSADGDVAVLTTDGQVTLYTASGEVEGSFQAMSAFELGEGHGAVRPALVFVGELLALTDTNTSDLVLFDAHDGDELSRLAVGAVPTGLVVTGLDPLASAGHDHDHGDEADHDHSDEAGHEDHDHADDHEGHDH